MSYLNSALNKALPSLPVQDYHVDTPLEEYDLVRAKYLVQGRSTPENLSDDNMPSFHLLQQNFCFPVKVLESNAVRLEPFIVTFCFNSL